MAEHQNKKMIGAEIGQKTLRRVAAIFKGSNGRKFTISEVIRQAVRESVLILEKDADAVEFLRRARISDVQELLAEDEGATRPELEVAQK